MASGAPSAMTTGIYQMPMLFADSLDVGMPSRHLSLLVMVKGQGRSGWMMWIALGLNPISGHVPLGRGVSTTANTKRMLESCAQVCLENPFLSLWVQTGGLYKREIKNSGDLFGQPPPVLMTSVVGQHIFLVLPRCKGSTKAHIMHQHIHTHREKKSVV